MEELLARLGFALMGKVVGERMEYRPEARQRAGVDGAVYVFLNADGSVWKVGMTRKGFSRADYTRVLDGRGMARPHEQRKLESIRRELDEGATQWVLQTGDPELVEALLACLLNPIESNRRQSQTERMLRRLTGR